MADPLQTITAILSGLEMVGSALGDRDAVSEVFKSVSAAEDRMTSTFAIWRENQKVLLGA